MQQHNTTLTHEKMDIAFVGHVDHGKSTVIGRLLADTDSLPKGKLQQVKSMCEKNSKPFEFAYLIDALKDERAQNITIDSARVFFKSKKRHYIIIDAPGHIEFIKNMVTGASRAEAAILVIDAAEGIMENSRRHGYLLGMLGVKQIIVLVNKMDLVENQQTVFEEIQSGYQKFLNEIDIHPICFIPVSGREGDNIVNHGTNMPWYTGTTLLNALDQFSKSTDLSNKPMRFPVQDVYRFTLFGDNRRIIAGKLLSGKIHENNEIIFYPSGKSSTIKSIESFSSQSSSVASAGQSIGFTLNEQIYVQRGQIACLPNEKPPVIAQKIRVSLFWLGKHPLVPKKQYTIKIGTERVKAEIEDIHKVIDAATLKNSKKQQIDHHDIAEVSFKLKKEIAIDIDSEIPDTNRFVIVDEYEIWGGGIILEGMIDNNQDELRKEILLRDKKWIRSTVSYMDRAERYNQRSSLIIITGKRHTGRKTLANLLERKLFDDGKFVYYLGVGSVLYSVNADLKRDGNDHWDEHVRRIGEITHLLLDTGIILILTAIEFTQSDLQQIQTHINSNQIETVWVGNEITTDINYDLLIEDEQGFEEAVVSIKELLREHGVIFRP